MSSTGLATSQFIRFAQLVVSNQSVGIDIPDGLRFRFEVRASDVATPNTAMIRIYNLSPDTVNTIITNATYVTLTAGYVNGNRGDIFAGNIKQMRRGKERNVDSFLDIFAADGDDAYNFGVANESLPADALGSQELAAYARAMSVSVSETADGFISTGGISANPRGKVAWGMARDYLTELAEEAQCRWSIQGGTLTLIPNTGYLPGEAVVLNSQTGLIGTPESTEEGITVLCNLNPLIKIGRLVQIANKDINQTVVNNQMFPQYTSLYYPATITDDGFYRVMVAEHVGDLRGGEWTTELICLAVDISANVQTSVQAGG